MIDMDSLDIRWMDRAACLAHPDLPWTADTCAMPEFVAAELTARMADICAMCRVLGQCAGMALGMTGGFWAGHDRAVKGNTRRSYVQPTLRFAAGSEAA